MSSRSLRRRMARWWLGILVLILAGTTACTGEAPGEPGTETRFISAREWTAEYERTVASFPERLPEGFQFAEHPSPPRGQIAESLGEAEAYFQWYCAWLGLALESSDSAVRAEGMTQLRRFPETSWAVDHLEDPDGVWEQTLESAELGDLGGLAEFHRTDCVLGAE
ncbi:hypothetical protein [Leucobacter sp. PH1c]|uniref:hypothetical protein n=1 Tax=Leucobacter sp. PH1c TaxID=1397278 RepID=UPI0012FEEAB1|nr:hypothetical protein [Leucobacter sp. PH1c]